MMHLEKAKNLQKKLKSLRPLQLKNNFKNKLSDKNKVGLKLKFNIRYKK